MASASDIRAGRAFVEVYADNDPLVKGLRAAQSRIRTFARTASDAGRQLIQAGTAVGLPFAASSIIFASFESQMSRVLALTNATADEFAALEAKARRLGETTVFSASQAAEAMSAFALAGFDPASILTAVGPTLDLAAAGMLSMADAAGIAIKVTKGMGIEVSELGRIMDVLTKAMTTANTDLVQIGEAMKFVGPVARVAGIQIEEITAAIQKLSDAGMGGELAGTALRGVLLALTNGDKIKRMKELGIAVEDAQGNFLPLVDVLRQFEAALAGMTQVERLNILGQIFDNRQVAGFATLLENGSDSLAAATAALEDSAGTAGRIAGIQLNNVTGAFILLKSSAEGLAITVGDVLAAPLRIALELFRRVTVAVTGWANENRAAVAVIAASTAGAIALGGALLGMAIVAQVAAFTVSGLLSIVGLLGAGVAAAGAAFTAILSPVGLVVAAFAAFAVAVLDVGSILSAVGRSIAGAFGQIRGTIEDTIDGAAAAIRGGDLQGATEIATLGMRVLWLQATQGIRQTWSQAVGDVAAGILRIQAFWDSAVLFMGSSWRRMVTVLPDLLGLASAQALNIIDQIRVAFASLGLVAQAALNPLADRDAIGAAIDAMYAELNRNNTNRLLDAASAFGDNQGTLDAIDSETVDRYAEIIRTLRDAIKSVDDDTRREIEDQINTLEKRKKELEDATRAAKDTAAGGNADEPTSPLADAARGIRDAIAGALGAAAARVDVSGSFESRAVSGASDANRLANRTAAAAESTAKNTKKIADAATRSQGIVYV